MCNRYFTCGITLLLELPRLLLEILSSDVVFDVYLLERERERERERKKEIDKELKIEYFFPSFAEIFLLHCSRSM